MLKGDKSQSLALNVKKKNKEQNRKYKLLALEYSNVSVEKEQELFKRDLIRKMGI